MITLSLESSTVLFLAAFAVIIFAGPKLAAVADRIADQTGLGEAITGSLFLGAATSLPGTVAVIYAAANDRPEFALATALGGIPAQSSFLGIADLLYRRANLEHAAASHANMLMSTMLLLLLSAVLVAVAAPDISVLGIHPVTFVIVPAYVGGLMITRRAGHEPMWRPIQTRETVEDKPDAVAKDSSLKLSLAQFVVLAALTGVAGWMMSVSGLNIAASTGLSETVVGSILVAIATSVPELVTSISAVRRGALTLAVGGIVGGNAYDTLVTGFADLAYRPGSIFHAVGDQVSFLLAWSLLMTGIILFGLLRRERLGFAGIGLEGVLLIALFLGGASVLAANF